MNISICFTSFNRVELLYEAVSPFIQDPRVSEIIISDDCSQIELYNTIIWQYKTVDKIKIFRNEVNLDCYLNKRQAVRLATNEWVALLDSDNVFGKDYIDRIENLWQAGLNARTIYQPEFARPHFDFRHIAGEKLDHLNIGRLIQKGNTGTMLNAMNYFFNAKEWLSVFDDSINPVTSDSIYQNYRWLNAGNNIYIVPGLQYDHRVGDHGSHYNENNKRTPEGFHDEIMRKLKEMR